MLRAVVLMLLAGGLGAMLVRRGPARVLLATAALAALAGAWQHGNALLAGTGLASALKTWVGQVLLAQAALALLAALMPRAVAWLAIVAAMACNALAGHAVSSREQVELSVAAVLHVLLAGAWLAALLAMLLVRPHDSADAWRQRLSRLSTVALPGMLVLLATGLVLSDWAVGFGAGLVATDYGRQLMVKLVLVAAALACAWRLRRWLAGHACQPGRWLSAEACLAGGVVAAAGTLAGIVPGAHDRIDWPWTFRLAPEPAWLLKAEQIKWPLGVSAGLALAGAVAAVVLRRRPRTAALALAGSLAGSAALALPAIAIDAYPTTYAMAEAPYDVQAVAAGGRQYRQHCVACHGAQGLGDGTLAATLTPRPANLTEPHVGWHTHGDLYWWLSKGIPRSPMPGFEAQTSPLERWQLINHLMALSLGHEARNLGGRPVPLKPWLPAIDFRYADAQGEFLSLAEWRRRAAVLLVLLDDAAELAAAQARLDSAAQLGSRVLVVAPPALAARLQAREAADVVPDDDGRIAAAWSHYRRTLANPDFRDEQPFPPRIEFLVDRFGFVRARWRSDEATADTATLAAAVRQLAAEPELRSPDVHAH